jgi:hypothetical protein
MPTKLAIHVFANVTALADVLNKYGISSAERLYDFVDGFNSVSELVTFSNIGHKKGITELKIIGFHVYYHR